MFHHIYKMLITLILVLSFAPIVSAADLNSRVFNFQKKLAESGNIQAQFKLAYMYETGRGVGKDFKKATQWYKKSSDKNYTAAKFRLKYLAVQTRGIKTSDRIWIKQLKASAASADGETLFLLAELYEKGTGVDKNLQTAHGYYLRSKAKDNPDADLKVYTLNQKIEKQKLKERARKRAAEKANQEKKKKAEAQRLIEQQNIQQAKINKAKKAEQKRKRLEANRKKLAAKKKKEKEQREALARKTENDKKQEAANEEAATKKPEDFESDLCAGAAARFMTQCE